MKKILMIIIAFSFLNSITYAQEKYDCKLGIYMVNPFNSKTPTLIYTDNTFKMKCDKTGYGSLTINHIIKSDIIIQFFQFVKKSHPEYLKDFKNTGFANHTVLYMEENEDFEWYVFEETKAKKFGFQIYKLSGFKYNPQKYEGYESPEWKEANNEYRDFFKTKS